MNVFWGDSLSHFFFISIKSILSALLACTIWSLNTCRTFLVMSHNAVINAEINVFGVRPISALLGNFHIGSHPLLVCERLLRWFSDSLHHFHLCRVLFECVFYVQKWLQIACWISSIISRNVVQVTEFCNAKSRFSVSDEIVGLILWAFKRHLQCRRFLISPKEPYKVSWNLPSPKYHIHKKYTMPTDNT